MKYCSHCGKQIENSAKSCPYCGADTDTYVPAPAASFSRNSSGLFFAATSAISIILMFLDWVELGIWGISAGGISPISVLTKPSYYSQVFDNYIMVVIIIGLCILLHGLVVFLALTQKENASLCGTFANALTIILVALLVFLFLSAGDDGYTSMTATVFAALVVACVGLYAGKRYSAD